MRKLATRNYQWHGWRETECARNESLSAIDFELGEGIVGKSGGICVVGRRFGGSFNRHGRAGAIALEAGLRQCGLAADFGLTRVFSALVARQRADHHVDAAAD